MVRAAADNDGLCNADWYEGWDDAIQRIDPDHNDPTPVELIEFPKDDPPAHASRPLPPRDATCARPACGHTGADHHHEGAACWATLPRTRNQFGTWGPIAVCQCPGFQAADH